MSMQPAALVLAGGAQSHREGLFLATLLAHLLGGLAKRFIHQKIVPLSAGLNLSGQPSRLGSSTAPGFTSLGMTIFDGRLPPLQRARLSAPSATLHGVTAQSRELAFQLIGLPAQSISDV